MPVGRVAGAGVRVPWRVPAWVRARRACGVWVCAVLGARADSITALAVALGGLQRTCLHR